MDKLLDFVNSIDYVFAAILLIGGRYWGMKYFRVSKNNDFNFLAFATAFGLIWILIQAMTVGVPKEAISSLFITYVFTTSFYQILAKKIFSSVEKLLGFGDAGYSGKGEEPIIVPYGSRFDFPVTGMPGVWYYSTKTGDYWYWDGSTYQNRGGDRPQKPPPV